MLQHDVITTFCLIALIERNWCCALTRQNNVMLQHDVITTSCLIIFQLTPSNQPTGNNPSNPQNQQSKQVHIPSHYRCKITTESRKVLYNKNPQHYFLKLQTQFMSKFNRLNKTSPTCLISIRPAALILLARLECYKRCLTFGS